MRTQEHAELKMIAGRWRTIRAGSARTLIKSLRGNSIDGGGWTDKQKATGVRQVEHINEHVGKKHGRM